MKEKQTQPITTVMKYVSYCRVSTKQQGIGLEAQKEIINTYVQQRNGTIVAHYEEKESGKDTIKREGLQSAIKDAKEQGAILIVAKLDRLSRDIHDIFTLKRDKHLSFEVCDIDASDTLTLGIFAALAQKERELISKRTKEALAALKAQGKHLGNPHAKEHMKRISEQGHQAKREKANKAEENVKAYAAIRYMFGTLTAKAEYLNTNGYRTRTGKQFTPMGVSLLIKRYGAAN